MAEMKLKHFKIINRISENGSNALLGGCERCDTYEDAPVCTDPKKDVQCTGERYRGCYPGQYDCADSPDNDNDLCCWGWGPGLGDNIDHAYCDHNDADWGGLCFFGWDNMPI